MPQSIYDLVRDGESLTWHELRERARNAEVVLPGPGQGIFAKRGQFRFELRETAQGKFEVLVTRVSAAGTA